MNKAASLSTVAIRSRKLSQSICGSKVLSLFFLLPFFKTDFVDYIGLTSVFNSILTIETIIFALLFLLTGFKSRMLWFLIIYFVWDLMVAPSMGGSQSPSAFYCFQAIGFSFYVLLGMKADAIKALDNLSFVLCLMSAFNLVLLLRFPDGVMQTSNGNLWPFGIRTAFSLVVIPGLCFSLLFDSFRGRGSFSLRTWTMLFVAVTTLVNQWVATGIIELLLLFVFYIIAKARGSLSMKTGVPIVVAVSIGLLFLGPSSIFGGFIDSLGKNMTLSGRTEIWAAVMAAISLKPLFGYGALSYVLVHDEVKACHNLWLNIAYESGIIGLFLYIPLYLQAAYNLEQSNRTGAGQIVSAFFLAILIAAIVEIQTYFPFIYGIIAITEALPRNSFDRYGTTLPVPMKIR